MAIISVAGLKAGLRQPQFLYKDGPGLEAGGLLASFFYTNPGAGMAPTPGMAGSALTAVAGQLPFQNPQNGDAYLAGISAGPNNFGQSGAYFLYDRLWHNSGINVTATGPQPVNSVAWPARDRDGEAHGDGVFVGIEVSTTLGNPAAITNTTLNYTNSAGVSGRTGTITSVPQTLAAVSLMFFELQSGDVGIRSVEAITLGTSYVSGVMHLVALRPITMWPFFVGPNPALVGLNDAIKLGLPRLHPDTVPCLLGCSTQAFVSGLFMNLQYAHG